MATQFKQDNPGCDCCGPCCERYWPDAAAAGVNAIDFDFTSALVNMSSTTNNTTGICGKSGFAQECFDISDIGAYKTKIDGPVYPDDCPTYPDGDTYFYIIGRYLVPTTSFATAPCSFSHGNVYGSGAYGRAVVYSAFSVTCDGSGNAVWTASTQMRYTVFYEYGVYVYPYCDFSAWRQPSHATMTGLGYSLETGGGTTYFKLSGLSLTGGILTGNGYGYTAGPSSSTLYAGSSLADRYWDITAVAQITSSNIADLVGWAGTLTPGYNPLGATVTYGVV